MSGKVSMVVRRGGRMGLIEKAKTRLWGGVHFMRYGGLVLSSELRAVVTRGELNGGQRLDLGVISRRVVSNNFAEALVDTLQGSEPANFEVYRFHAMGTGATAEAQTQNALITEVESRDSGTQTENGSKVYRSVGTTTATATRLIREHGLFDQLAAGGNMLDRSLFALITLENTDTITFTYDLTVTAGG